MSSRRFASATVLWMGKMFFNILATFAEFEVDLLRMRTREGMAVARAKSRLRGKQPKLSAKQQTELRRMHATGDYSIADLAELSASAEPRCTGLSNGKPPEKADSPRYRNFSPAPPVVG
jgi:DNA invertase Pin-like site-specific DNA recombinase